MNIPKPDGTQRPLGIPTIRDRVVQTAALLVLEPIFEADLQPEQHAYRPCHSAHDALQDIKTLVDQGHVEVVDADLSGVLRQHSARGASEIGSPSRQRRGDAAAGEAVARGPGGRNRRARTHAKDDPQQGRRAWARPPARSGA